MRPIDKRIGTRLFILGFLALGVGFLLYASGIVDFFIDKDLLLAFVEERKAYTVFVFIGLQVMQVVVAFLPGEVTGFVGGILFGPVWGIIFSTIGLAVGSWIAFNLSRIIGRPLVDRLTSHETIKRYDYVMKHKGLLLAFLLFLIPGFPKDILCYLLGLSRMRQVDFLMMSTVGRLLGTTLLAIGGSYFRDERYGAFFTIIGISIGMILIALAYRGRIERLFRKIHATQRLRSMREKRKLRQKERGTGD